MDYNEIILQAIDTVVETRLANFGTDRTEVCTIIDDSKKEEGIYRVTPDNAITYEAYSETTTYKKDQSVYVLIPKNNTQKLILSKYTDKDANTPITYVPPKRKLASEHKVTSSMLNGEFFCDVNGTTISKVIVENFNVPEGTKNLDTIYLKADFKCPLQDYTVTSGSYGLVLIGTIKDSAEKRVMVLSSNNMLGNPFGFTTYFKQEQNFSYEIDNDFESFSLILYQDAKFKCLDPVYGNEIPLPTSSSGAHKITVKNIEISFGTDVSGIEDKTAKLTTVNSLDYDPQKNLHEIKQIRLAWYNKDENNQFLGFSDGSFGETRDLNGVIVNNAENYPKDGKTYYTIKWYQDNLNGSFTYLNEFDDQQEISISCQPNFVRTDIFAYIWRNGIKYQTEVLSFKNVMVDISQDLTWLGITLNVINAGEGKDAYALYGSDNRLMDKTQSSKRRQVTISWNSKDSIITDDFWEGAYIYWYLPINNTMLKDSIVNYSENSPFEEVDSDRLGYKCYRSKSPLTLDENKKLKSEEITFNYTIKNVYSKTAINNTIYCRLEKYPSLFVASKPTDKRVAETYWKDTDCDIDVKEKQFELKINIPANTTKNQFFMYQRGIQLQKNKEYSISADFQNTIKWKSVIGEEIYYSFRPTFLIRKQNENSWRNLHIFSQTSENVTSNEDQKILNFKTTYTPLEDGIYEIGIGCYKTNIHMVEYTKEWNGGVVIIKNPICAETGSKPQHVESFKQFEFSNFGTSGTEYNIVITPTYKNLLNEYITKSFDLTLPQGETITYFASVYDKDGKNLEDKEVKLYLNNNERQPGEDISFDKNLIQYRVIEARATVEWGGNNVELKVQHPIIYSKDGKYTTNAPTEIIYDSFGKLASSGFSSLELYSLDTEEKVNNVSWTIIYLNANNEKTSLTNLATLSWLPTISNNNTIAPAVMYDSNPDYYSILVASDAEGNIYWVSPLIITQNQYSSSVLNNWNGNFYIDEENNYLLTAMLGTGSKNSNNQFTGVLLGDLKKLNSSEDIPMGLYGYHEGAQSFGFKTDGTAFIGKSSVGRIEFDGNMGIISSPGWTVTKNDENTYIYENENENISRGSIWNLSNSDFILKKSDNELLSFTDDGLIIKSDNIQFGSGGTIRNYIDNNNNAIISEVRKQANYYGVGSKNEVNNGSWGVKLEEPLPAQTTLFKNGVIVAVTFTHSITVNDCKALKLNFTLNEGYDQDNYGYPIRYRELETSDSNMFFWRAGATVFFSFATEIDDVGKEKHYWDIVESLSDTYSKITQTANSVISEVRRVGGYACTAEWDSLDETCHKWLLEINTGLAASLNDAKETGVTIAVKFSGGENSSKDIWFYDTVNETWHAIYSGNNIAGPNNKLTWARNTVLYFTYDANITHNSGNNAYPGVWKISDLGASSKITQLADNINAEVLSTNGTKGESGFAWDLNAESFKLSSKISGQWNDVFICNSSGVEVNGKITADNGKIASWFIGTTEAGWNSSNANAIYTDCLYNQWTDTTTNIDYLVFLRAPSGKSSNVFSIRERKNGEITTPFYITREGALKATKGTIGGCSIEDGKLKVPVANIDGEITASALTVKNSNGTPIFSAGNNSVSMAGWTVGSTSLKKGDFGDSNSICFHSSGTSGSYTVGGRNGDNWALTIGNTFGVTIDGGLYCTNLNCEGGVIAGWSITATAITSKWVDMKTGSATPNPRYYQYRLSKSNGLQIRTANDTSNPSSWSIIK